jgi:hypothetical protein
MALWPGFSERLKYNLFSAIRTALFLSVPSAPSVAGAFFRQFPNFAARIARMAMPR